jgi:hypothetical protein
LLAVKVLVIAHACGRMQCRLQCYTACGTYVSSIVHCRMVYSLWLFSVLNAAVMFMLLSLL